MISLSKKLDSRETCSKGTVADPENHYKCWDTYLPNWIPKDTRNMPNSGFNTFVINIKVVEHLMATVQRICPAVGVCKNCVQASKYSSLQRPAPRASLQFYPSTCNQSELCTCTSSYAGAAHCWAEPTLSGCAVLGAGGAVPWATRHWGCDYIRPALTLMLFQNKTLSAGRTKLTPLHVYHVSQSTPPTGCTRKQICSRWCLQGRTSVSAHQGRGQ